MKQFKLKNWWVVFSVILSAQLLFGQVIQVDEKLPEYQQTIGISGNANSIGSDTMNNLMTLWLEQFKKYYPLVNIQIEGKGSSTAPPALIEGTAQFGPMSRAMKTKEMDAFEKKYGFKPTQIRTALDALAVFVHKDNPIECLTLKQVDAIFSKTRSRGFPKEVNTWGQLDLTGMWMNKPISIYGRNSASGTYGFFKKNVLKRGDFKNVVKEQPGSASVVQGITEDKFGIGYSGIGYQTSGVKTISIAEKEGGPCYEGSYENVLTEKYPLSRFLYIYIVKYPNKPLDPLIKEFLKFVLSTEGQKIVVKDGYLPLSSESVQKELKKME